MRKRLSACEMNLDLVSSSHPRTEFSGEDCASRPWPTTNSTSVFRSIEPMAVSLAAFVLLSCSGRRKALTIMFMSSGKCAETWLLFGGLN